MYMLLKIWFDYIKKILKQYYLNDIDEEKAEEGAIEGYVSSLGDPYTEYIPKAKMEDVIDVVKQLQQDEIDLNAQHLKSLMGF